MMLNQHFTHCCLCLNSTTIRLFLKITGIVVHFLKDDALIPLCAFVFALQVLYQAASGGKVDQGKLAGTM